MAKTQRIRDSVHGLIVFDSEGREARLDQTAWNLLNTPEMQRLRRIRQLGVSEFTFPGATHTRFAHSVGVFETARQLVRVLQSKLEPADRDSDRAAIAVLAALLHDIGHGPFSHAFEEAQKARGEEKHHENWSAEIIRNSAGRVFPLLEKYRAGMAEQIAGLLSADVPQDAYHAVVSSSFDADRLDYLRRDRIMTGSGAGAIDFDWLIDNLRVADISVGADDDDLLEGKRKTFCLDRKAFQAAESFLLARYHLFEQVYLHKTTRGLENVVSQLLQGIATAASKGEHELIGLDGRDPLVSFFGPNGGSIEDYLALDDASVWSAASRIARLSSEERLREFASRLLARQPFRHIDVQGMFPLRPGELTEDAEARWQAIIRKLDELFEAELGNSVFKDVSSINIYSEVGSDTTKAQKRLMILVDRLPREITQLSYTIRSLQTKRNLVRYFFIDEATRARALEALK